MPAENEPPVPRGDRGMERGQYSRPLLYFKPRLASRTAGLIGGGGRVRSNTRSKSASGPSFFAHHEIRQLPSRQIDVT
jgi:hypothetical protein